METATVPDGGSGLTRGQRDMLKAREYHARVKSAPCLTCGKSRWNIRGTATAYCAHCNPSDFPPAASSAKQSDAARLALSLKKRRLLLSKHSSF
jgi:hypothetical protein